MGFLICHKTKKPKLCDGTISIPTEEDLPVLIKLGYEHLIPKLKAELNKEYEIDRFTGRTFKIFDDVSLSDEGVKR